MDEDGFYAIDLSEFYEESKDTAENTRHSKVVHIRKEEYEGTAATVVEESFSDVLWKTVKSVAKEVVNGARTIADVLSEHLAT